MGLRRAFLATVASIGVVMTLTAAPVTAAPARLDPTFSGDGIRIDNPTAHCDDAAAVLAQRDAKTVVAGPTEGFFAGGCRPVTVGYVIRYTARGARDTTFSRDGVAAFGFRTASGIREHLGILAVRQQYDGKYVVLATVWAGGLEQPHRIGVVRLTSSGHLDRTFSGDGKVLLNLRYQPQHMTIQYDGKIVIAAAPTGFSINAPFVVVRLGTHGGLDKSFSGDGIRLVRFPHGAGEVSTARAAHVHELLDGRIVVTGTVREGQGGEYQPHVAIARMWANGSLDRSFSGDGRVVSNLTGDDEVSASVVQRDGKIVVVGLCAPQGGPATLVARYGPTGGLDRTFGGGRGYRCQNVGSKLAALATDVALDPAQRIVYVGYVFLGGTYRLEVARLLRNGVPDRTFDRDGMRTVLAGFYSVAYGVAVGNDGRIVAAGATDTAALVNAKVLVVRFVGTP